MKGLETTNYRCVICHHPEDASWASWLAEELDVYQVPRKIVGCMNRRGSRIPSRIGPLTTLEAGGPLLASEQRETLRIAEFIIVICSPSAAGAEAVGECIRLSKSMGKSDRIIAVITEGVPNASGAQAEWECFPRALRFEVDTEGHILALPAEPLAADFRVEGRDPGWFDVDAYGETLTSLGRSGDEVRALCAHQTQRLRLMKLKVIAGMLGIDLGELTEREKAYQSELNRRRLLRWLGVGIILLILGFAGVKGFSVLSEYRADAVRAAEAESAAKERAALAAAERESIDARNLRQAELFRVAGEKAKGLAYMNGEGGLPKDRTLALEHLGKAAAAGDVAAGLWYAKLLVDKPSPDDETARGLEKLLQIKTAGVSPESGEAAHVLGRLYAAGKVVKWDRSKAMEHTEFASAAGHVPAMEPFAYMLERGWGGPARISEALVWYERAAAAESPEGLFALYLIYRDGRPAFKVAANPSAAEGYLTRAANAGSSRALFRLSQSAKDPTEAEQLLVKAASKGEPRAMLALVGLYLGGEGGHAVIIDKGVYYAGFTLENSLESGDVKTVDKVGEILLRANVVDHCGSILPQLRRAAESGNPRSSYIYALLNAPPAAAKSPDMSTYKTFMLKAAEAGLDAAQYDLGRVAQGGLVAGVSREAAATWIEKAASQGYRPALLPAATNRREGGILPKDWKLAADFMRKASDQGMAVDWTEMPRRFRPKAAVGVLTSSVFSVRPIQVQPAIEKLNEARKVIEGTAKRTKEAVDEVMRTFPLTAAWSQETLRSIGVMLMSMGRYDDGVAYLSRAVLRETPVASHGAARTLSNYFEATKPALAYQWYLLALSRSNDRGSEIGLSRLKLGDSQKEAALAAASGLLVQDKLEAAAEAAGLAVLVFPRKVNVDGAALGALLSRADAELARAEFPEEAEEAMRIYGQALAEAPDSLAALNGIYRSALLLKDEKKSFYWLLRCASAKRTATESSFEAYVELARAYHLGLGVGADPIEAEKWCTLARAEIPHAQAVATAAGVAEDIRRGFATAQKKLAELDLPVAATSQNNPQLALRLKLHRAAMAGPALR